MNPQAQLASTLNAGPQAVPPAFTPGSVALPQVPAAYSQYFKDRAGFGANAIGAGETQAKASISDYSASQGASARAKQITDRINELALLKDPSKYQQIKKSDGGYDFKDPLGNPINIQQFAQITQQDPQTILKSSQNPVDKQHNADYANMIKITDALYNNDDAKLKTAIPQIFGDKANVDDTLKQLKSINPYALYQSFVNHYPSIYGQQPQTGTFSGPSFTDSIYGAKTPAPQTGGSLGQILPGLLGTLQATIGQGR